MPDNNNLKIPWYYQAFQEVPTSYLLSGKKVFDQGAHDLLRWSGVADVWRDQTTKNTLCIANPSCAQTNKITNLIFIDVLHIATSDNEAVVGLLVLSRGGQYLTWKYSIDILIHHKYVKISIIMHQIKNHKNYCILNPYTLPFQR